jgi:hypothetical protein
VIAAFLERQAVYSEYAVPANVSTSSGAAFLPGAGYRARPARLRLSPAS